MVHSGVYRGNVIHRRDRGFSLVLHRVYSVVLVRRKRKLKVMRLCRASRGAVLHCSLAMVGYRLCCVQFTLTGHGIRLSRGRVWFYMLCL